MRQLIIRIAFWMLGIHQLYREIVVRDQLTDIHTKIRSELVALLSAANCDNPFFAGRFTEFLDSVRDVDNSTFFECYARLPSFSKQDYANAGWNVMPADVVERLSERELPLDGRPWDFLARLRRGEFLMPMATGGSTSTPLTVQMTKQHMFSMLFTFFKCWYRMGWRPGDRMLVFYPRNTYNIDEMSRYNRFSWVTGFRIQLFSQIDECTIRELVAEINRFRPRLFLVFPSPMNMIANTIRQHRLELRHHPELINVSGETFFDCQRRNIQEVFYRSKLEDSYGSVELGEIAHETADGLEIFANVAYVETEPNSEGQPEMIVTRLGLHDFPFIRYRMRDVAQVQFLTRSDGTECFAITKIEGKDSNYILSDSGHRYYPSFFNQFVNDLNREFGDVIVEIKVYERGQQELEVQFIVNRGTHQRQITETAKDWLSQRISPNMQYTIHFVDYIQHDYRRKYRVIERIGDIEYAGGIVGDARKLALIEKHSA